MHGLIFLCLVSMPMLMQANNTLSKDLNAYFKGLGFNSNVSDASVYKGQQGGAYTGGSVYARAGVRNLQLMQLNLPSIQAGCGGIDLYTGGFSYINKQDFIDFGKNILNNAAGYAFKLALSSVSPMISTTLESLQATANEINQFNLNSCETSTALLGAMWPKVQQSAQAACQSIGTETGKFSDYAAARLACGAGKQTDSVLAQYKQQEAYNNLIPLKTNIAWQAIQQNAFLRENSELSELFMNLSGTVIVGERIDEIEILPSLASNKNVLNALLRGGRVELYRCTETGDDKRCLHPKRRSFDIDPSSAMRTKVIQVLDSMLEKLYDDRPLSEAEIQFLNMTTLPVYKMLTVQAAYGAAIAKRYLYDHADLIATDLIEQYVTESLKLIKNSAQTLQFPPSLMAQFNDTLESARSEMHDIRRGQYQNWALRQQVIDQTRAQEKALVHNMADYFVSKEP